MLRTARDGHLCCAHRPDRHVRPPTRPPAHAALALQEDAGPHRALYNFVGRLALLRPSESLPFVHGPADAAHPMLPNLPALYRVGLPDEASASPAGGMLDYAAASLASWDELLDGTAFAAAMQKAQEALHWGCGRREQARLAKMAEMQANVLQFMNHPHPLTILSEYQVTAGASVGVSVPLGCLFGSAGGLLHLLWTGRGVRKQSRSHVQRLTSPVAQAGRQGRAPPHPAPHSACRLILPACPPAA